MNYIFLDVDGVLNNKKHYSKQHKKYGGRFFMEAMPFNPRSLKNLRKILKATDAKLILSSSWRGSDRCMIVLKARLAEYGIKISDQTDFIDGKRGIEINKWLQEKGMKRIIYADNKPIEVLDCNYIIIDDEDYDLIDCGFESKMIKINSYVGLTWNKTREAIKKLRR